MEIKNEEKEICEAIIQNTLNKSKKYKCIVKYKVRSSPGLLYEIPIQGHDTLFKVVITALHPFNGLSLKNEEIEINYQGIPYYISVDFSRTFYSSDEYDIIFIEIKDYDGLSNFNFLELNFELLKMETELLNQNISLPQDTFEMVFAYIFGSIIGADGYNPFKNLGNNNIYMGNSKENNNVGICIKKTLERFYKKIKEILINNKINFS